jgi:flavin reductase (DIM6/NTAB) family NADH-FMN oxidoreductase RutF
MPARHHRYETALASFPAVCEPCRHPEVRTLSAISLAVPAQHDERQLFRKVMGRFATGVTVVTTRIGEETFGMTANAFMAGSLDPMLCVVSINHTSQMHGRLRLAGHFGVSFLSQQQQHLAAQFAGKRLGGLVPDFELHGRTPILKRALAAVTADVVETTECGDHTLFIGSVNGLILGDDAAAPLLFFGGRYSRLDTRAPIDQAEPPEFW